VKILTQSVSKFQLTLTSHKDTRHKTRHTKHKFMCSSEPISLNVYGDEEFFERSCREKLDVGSKKRTAPPSLAVVKMNNREPNAQDYYVTTTVAKPFCRVMELREKYLPRLLQHILRKWISLWAC